MYIGVDGPLYAFSMFSPTIAKSLGTWSSVGSNLLTVPIYIWACLVRACVGFYADRKGHRARISLIYFLIGTIGYIILIAIDPRKSLGASYFCICLAAAGIVSRGCILLRATVKSLLTVTRVRVALSIL